MVLPLLIGGTAVVGTYLFGKKQGQMTAYKEVASSEPAVSRVMKAANSLIMTVAILAGIFVMVKKFGK
jgi:hypothetical protein